MKRVTLFATALALVVFAVLAGRARARTFNTQEKTFLTFNVPVELPGRHVADATRPATAGFDA